jgi:hypothetical protein
MHSESFDRAQHEREEHQFDPRDTQGIVSVVLVCREKPAVRLLVLFKRSASVPAQKFAQ